MHPCDDQPHDSAIIDLLAKNDKTGWVNLYDKYASLLYGIILNITGNEILAGEILTEVFLKLKNEKLRSSGQTNLCHELVRHT